MTESSGKGGYGSKVLVAALSLAALILFSIGIAGVFTYYPATINISPVSSKQVVNFTAGSNAGQPDLGAGNTISVTIGSSGASATITIHPTFQTTYYKNITLIRNTESGQNAKAYNVYIRVVPPAASLPANSQAVLYIYNKGATRQLPATGYVASVNLLSTGTTYIGSLNAGSAWEVDVLVYIPEGSTVTSSTAAQIQLIYTPSSETPP